MNKTSIAFQRLSQQRLSQTMLTTPQEVVSWLGAVQSQDYPGAKWALGMRMQSSTEAGIDQAFDAGAILRTHVMRPTWHFVMPEDIRWMLELTAPRVNTLNGYMYRQLGLDEALFIRSNEVIARALQGGHHLTRAELGEALRQGGFSTEDLRLTMFVFRAELDGIVCSGPRRGKQFTYALMDERAPQAHRLTRDEALAELTRRYFVSHGPATVHDFSWWSGLTVADAKMGLHMSASHLTSEISEGQTYWFSAEQAAITEASQEAFLLSTFDEFLVGYDGFDHARRANNPTNPLVFEATVVIGGQVVGSWKRTLKKESVLVEIAPFSYFTSAQEEAVSLAAQRYADFLGLPLRAEFVMPEGLIS